MKALKNNLLVIVGPTSSGKSELAVKLAKKYGGEIISADSRQVYCGMNIGSGKIEGRLKKGGYIYKGISHYGIDVASPKIQYSVARFKSLAESAIKDITARGKLPILCGGTGHWIDAVAFDQDLPAVNPDPKLRRRLEKKSTAELFAMLKRLDPKRAKTIDKKNPRRLIRALEIVITTGKPVPALKQQSPYNILWLGISMSQEKLYKKIEQRLDQRLKQGMLHEVKKLHRQGASWKRLEEFGLEYKYCALRLQKKLSKEEMRNQLLQAIKQYTKRQMTWWKRNKDIKWIEA